MRKSLLLLVVAMLLPVFAMADNKAISKSVTNYSNTAKTQPRLELPATVLGVASLPEAEDTEIAYSVGEWVKITGVQAQSDIETGAVLMSYNTWKQMNQNGVWVIHCDANGTLTGKGFGSGNGGLFGLGMPSTLGSMTLNEWHYIMLVVDNANAKAAFYVDGVKTQSANLTGKVRYIWDDGNVQFLGWGCGGALDEVNIYHKALTDEEAQASYANARAVSGLAAQYTFDEVKAGTTGLFANQITTGAAASVDAQYSNVTYAALWAAGGYVNAPTEGVQTAPTLVDGREIALEDVNVSLEQAEGGVLTVTCGEDSWSGDDEFTVAGGSTLHFSAVPEEGYELTGIFVTSLTSGETTQLNNNSDYVVVEDIMISVSYSNNLHTLTVVKPDDVTITLAAGGVELTDYTKVIDDTDYVLTVNVPENKTLVAVELDGVALTAAANGTYTVNLTADATLEVKTADKAVYTVTINQPQGGTVTVNKGTATITNGATVAEGSVLSLSNTPATGYTFANYVVNGANTSSATVTVNGDVTISAIFDEAPEASYTAPTGSEVDANGYLESITTTGAKTDLNISHTGKNKTSTAYEHCSHATLEVTQGSEFDMNLVAKYASTTTTSAPSVQDLRYCVAYIFEDFDGDGVFTFVDRWGNFADEATRENNSGVSNAWTNNVKANYDLVMNITQHFTVPADARLGNCRIRVIYTEAWDNTAKNSANKIISGDYQSINKGYAYDFDVVVVRDQLAAERTVSVASNYEALGTVAITSPATADASITTNVARVVVEATATEGTFVNWTNAAGSVVATTASYGYTGTEDAELTANFGCALTYSYTGEGSLSFTTADGAARNNDVLDYGTEVTLTVAPAQGQRVESVMVNNVRQDVVGNQVTFTMEKNTNVRVSFAEATFAITWNVSGNGTVRAFPEWGDNLEELEAMGEIHSGDMMPSSGTIFFVLIPGTNNDLDSAVFTSGSISDEWSAEDFENSEDAPIDGIESDLYYSSEVYVADLVDGEDLVLSVSFIPTGSAINEILGDEMGGNVEYYNLQGVKINGENLTPGIYVARNGNKAVKVLVK